MNLAKVSANGQVTVPVEIRRKLNLKEGDKILFFERNGGEIVINNASAAAPALVTAREPVVETPKNTIPEKYKEDINKAIKILKNEGCKNVYLFGSLVTGKTHDRSDIDIGIKGLPPEMFLKVYSDLSNTLDNKFDLVDFDFNCDFFSLLERLNEVVEIG
jgi:AbrB family looped-hinge helix DNA binding protein